MTCVERARTTGEIVYSQGPLISNRNKTHYSNICTFSTFGMEMGILTVVCMYKMFRASFFGHLPVYRINIMRWEEWEGLSPATRNHPYK